MRQADEDIEFEWMDNPSHGNPPGVRSFHTCDVVEDSGKMILLGGNHLKNDYYVYDFVNESWRREEISFSIKEHSSCLIRFPSKTRILIFGGVIDGVHLSSAIYEFVLTRSDTREEFKFVQTNGITKPSARKGHTAVLSPDRKYMFIHGGLNEDGQVFNDLHKYDHSQRTWTVIQPSSNSILPPKLYYHASITIKKTNTMLVGCGHDGKGPKNDFYEFNFTTEKWRKMIEHKNEVVPRNSHKMISIDNESRIILGPGYIPPHIDVSSDQEEDLTTFCELDLKSMTWKKFPVFTKDKLLWSYSMVRYADEMIIYGGGSVSVTSECKFGSLRRKSKNFTSLVSISLTSREKKKVKEPSLMMIKKEELEEEGEEEEDVVEMAIRGK